MNAVPQVTELQQPPKVPFLMENWKRLISFRCKEALRLVRIVNGVANVTNGYVLLRTNINLPDGFYLPDSNNDLIPFRPHSWLEYPDVEQARPPFEAMTPYCQIQCVEIQRMLPFLKDAAHNKADILMDKQGLVWRHNHNNFVEFAFNTPGDPLPLNPLGLFIVFTELLRYPEGVWLSRERRIDQSCTPLVFGQDWRRCAFIIPAPPYDW